MRNAFRMVFLGRTESKNPQEKMREEKSSTLGVLQKIKYFG